MNLKYKITYHQILTKAFLSPFSPMPVLIGLKLTRRRGLVAKCFCQNNMNSRAPPSWHGPPYHCHQNDIVRRSLQYCHAEPCADENQYRFSISEILTFVRMTLLGGG